MRLYILLAMLAMALFLQVTLLNFFTIFGVKPDLVLIIVVFNAFLRGSGKGALVGFWGGLFVDLAAGSYIGVNALSLMAVGYLVGMTESKLYKDGSLIVFFLVWMSSFTAQILNYILLSLMGVHIVPGVALFKVIIPTATYTAALVPFLYRRFYRSNQEGWLYSSKI
ncbi:MAG: rod shape-determining protein MreD [Peptococcaceae bacterium]|nr:rod shape-determining protein MreD [Peptococcaceae bacterium]